MDDNTNIFRNQHSNQNANSSNDEIEKSEKLDFGAPTYDYKSCDEYATAVNQWLWLCYNWQYMSMALPNSLSQAAFRIQNTNSGGTTDFNRNFPNTFFPNQNFSLFQANLQNAARQNEHMHGSYQSSQGNVYIIPSLFKRLAAETIDSSILLVLKLMITYIAVDIFDFVHFEKYHMKLVNYNSLDYQTAIEVTSEIIALEIIHRILVCMFEAVFTHKGINGIGGATPGKLLMRLRIVTCENVVQLQGNYVRIYPASDLGFSWALVRSFVKNFSYAFILPIYCTMYFFQYNRTAYDHMCGSIVVEELPTRTQLNH